VDEIVRDVLELLTIEELATVTKELETVWEGEIKSLTDGGTVVDVGTITDILTDLSLHIKF
jgi:ribosomal protein S1